jgi:hypothetical protein
MEELHTEYDKLVAAGEIRPPTSMERMERAANGLPESARTQAAQRVLEKRLARMRGQEG